MKPSYIRTINLKTAAACLPARNATLYFSFTDCDHMEATDDYDLQVCQQIPYVPKWRGVYITAFIGNGFYDTDEPLASMKVNGKTTRKAVRAFVERACADCKVTDTRHILECFNL